MGVLDDLMEQVGGDRLGQIAGAIGGGESETKSAIDTALPALLSGLARNTRTPEGAASLSSALGDHDGSVLDNLGSLFSGGDSSDGDGILGHVLGDRREQVTQHIAGSSGLGVGQISKLLPMLAPMVMGVLGKKQRSEGLDSGGLASMLDRDGDGNMLDDIGGLLKGGLGGALGGGNSGGSQKSGGGIGALIGRLFGRK